MNLPPLVSALFACQASDVVRLRDIFIVYLALVCSPKEEPLLAVQVTVTAQQVHPH